MIFLLSGAALLRGQEFSLSTNAVDYALGGTLNIGASWGPSRHWTVEAEAKYNPFSSGSGSAEHFDKQRMLRAGARWWPWYIYSGWWLSGSAGVQEFSTASKGNPQTSEGSRYGAGLGGGYSKMLGSHFNLDLGISFWAGYESKTVYACQHCGRTIGSSGGAFILPADILVALSYIF